MWELTPMQAAYWAGEHSLWPHGGVKAHIYAEFNGKGLDLERLQRAVALLFARHPVLSLCVDQEGRQSIASPSSQTVLHKDDYRSLPAAQTEQKLLHKRHCWTHHGPDLASGKAASFSISLIDHERFRLHVDASMIAVDPPSFRQMMEDLVTLYEAPETIAATPPSFIDWLQVHTSAVRRSQDSDKAWWRARLGQVSPAPSLPFLDSTPRQILSHRLSHWLDTSCCQLFQQFARNCHVTKTSLMMSVFSQSLARLTGDRRFRLSVPSFWRTPEPTIDIGGIVGELSTLLILDVDLDAADSTEGLSQWIWGQLAQALSHATYPGVSVMRDLSQRQGKPQFSPVVFTSALDLPGGDLFSARLQNRLGHLDWVISQCPMVALDAQFVSHDGGMLINWDVRLDLLPRNWVERLFEDFVTSLTSLVNTSPTRSARYTSTLSMNLLPDSVVPEKSHVANDAVATLFPASNVKEIHPGNATRLNAMQSAYLMGRGLHSPMGGVAMQEFREYRGHVDADKLRERLLEMVRHHECLRTIIDPDRIIQYVRNTPILNLKEIDLRTQSYHCAVHALNAARRRYSHDHLPLASSPWDITLFHLPAQHGGTEECVVFAKFDAQIVDGMAIAILMNQLLDGSVPLDLKRDALAEVTKIEQPEIDAAYWKDRLASYDGAIRLPWKRPLADIPTSRYRRKSIIIQGSHYKLAMKAGSSFGLFPNTIMLAIILDTLSTLVQDGQMFIGIPVAPGLPTTLTNHSSFLAVKWPSSAQKLSDKAKEIQQDVLNGLKHLSGAGIGLGRLLMEKGFTPPAFPVVVTNGLSWPAPTCTSAMHYVGGLTQTPQVAMDIRLSHDAGRNLILDIDYAVEAIDDDIVSSYLLSLRQRVLSIAESGQLSSGGPAVTEFTTDPLANLQHHLTASHGQRFLSRLAINLFRDGTNKIALIQGSRQVTYSELGRMIRCVMRALRERAVDAGDTVAICLPRSPEQTASVLGCALYGAIWVPIDAKSPPDRLAYMIGNCDPALIISMRSISCNVPTVGVQELLSTEPITSLPEDFHERSFSEAPSYYLYTSGTTGLPKCVVLSNRATANVIDTTIAEWNVTDKDVFISVTPIHHDMSIFDVIGCLSSGGTLVQPEPEKEKDAVHWNELVHQHGVTIWCSVPAILEMLLACRRGSALDSLRVIAQGGDYIKASVIHTLRELLPDARLVSLGGPTETTIWSIWHEICDQDTTSIPYGSPLPGNSYFILDENNVPCPTGQTGRIHTSGINLALGYLHNGQIHQTDFVMIPTDDSSLTRAYRTGDLGMIRPDGKIMFEGRIAGYVKVRGVRISLQEVEDCLVTHPSLKGVLAFDHQNSATGEVSLSVLYTVRDRHSVTPHDLRTYARNRLPESHMPTLFHRVDSIPLSSTGKPDRNAARKLTVASDNPKSFTTTNEKDTTPDMNRIISIYTEVIGSVGQPVISYETPFISTGLLPRHVKVISERLRNAFHLNIRPSALIPCKTPREVLDLLNRKQITSPTSTSNSQDSKSETYTIPPSRSSSK